MTWFFSYCFYYLHKISWKCCARPRKWVHKWVHKLFSLFCVLVHKIWKLLILIAYRRFFASPKKWYLCNSVSNYFSNFADMDRDRIFVLALASVLLLLFFACENQQKRIYSSVLQSIDSLTYTSPKRALARLDSLDSCTDRQCVELSMWAKLLRLKARYKDLKFRKWININLLVYKYTYYVAYGQQDYFRWNLPATL